MKIQISKNVHSKLRKLAQANEITIQALANELLARMLNHHKNELEQIIKKVKNENG